MPINPADIERLKNGIDLAAYIAARGIALNRNGKNHKALCPFHEEASPSFTVNPEENLWHCFGCGAGGDVFTFVERMDRVSFTKAVGIVGKNASMVRPGPLGQAHHVQTLPPPSPSIPLPSREREDLRTQAPTHLSPSHQKLLNRVVQFYQLEFWKDQRGLNYLKQRGIHDKQSLIDFGAGFANGNLSEILSPDGDHEAALRQIGILNERNHEMFYGCVVFPLLDLSNNTVGLYGRRIDEDQVKHLYLPGPRRGLINRQAAKRSKILLLTESIIDALSLYANGFKNVIPLYGVNGWTEDHAKLFKECRPDAVTLCFDSDEAGMKGAEAVKEKIGSMMQEAGSKTEIRVMRLPAKDLNDYFRKYPPEEFEKLLQAANPQGGGEDRDGSTRRGEPVEPSSPCPGTGSPQRIKEERFFEETPHGFCVGYGKREYEIKGIAKTGTQLKATIKAGCDLKGGGRFQITTIDLYSLRSREWFAKMAGELTGERPELVKEDLCRILTRLEAYSPVKKEKKEAVLTAGEKEEALAFLSSPNLFDEILSDLEFLGCTGEETNKLVSYLVSISRKMEEPLALLIRSRSAAGKSTLQEAILALVPEEDFIKYTRLTDQALFYKEENSLVHKLLAIEEAAGIGGSAYSIRALQSSKQLTVATTSKDPATGKMKTEEYTVNGPLSLMLTTTAVDLDPEMESRFLTIAIDESKEMTSRIHRKQRESDTLQGYLAKKKSDFCVKKHRNAQRLLRPLAVVNPYAPHLAFPSENLRSRRDHKKYLNLIKACAFLCQYQRPVKELKIGAETVSYVEVTLEDIARANKIANEVLGKSLDELSSPGRTLLSHIHRMVKEKQTAPSGGSTPSAFSFNRRIIREYAKWSEWQVRLHIGELEDLGYVYARMGAHGKEYVYEVNLQAPDDPAKKMYLGLTEISQLEKVRVNFEG